MYTIGLSLGVCICLPFWLPSIYLAFHSLSVFSFCYFGRLCIFHILIPSFIHSPINLVSNKCQVLEIENLRNIVFVLMELIKGDRDT